MEDWERISREAPWRQKLPQGYFEDYVAAEQVNDEPVEDYRGVFFAALWPMVKDLAPVEAALAVNRWCAGHVTYRFNDSPTAGALTVYYRGHGRCGEESVFAVAALRSVGFPARQVYVPRWSHCDDNHAWVEVFAEGKWRYFGACEPEPVPDRGWFTSPAARAMLVRARQGEGRYENVTGRYAPTQRWTFRTGCPGAKLTLHILNDGAFQPIWTLTADGKGEASEVLGIGDLFVTAEGDGFYGELLCKGKAGDEFVIPETGRRYHEGEVLRFEAPDPPKTFPRPLTALEKARREEALRQAAAEREAWRQAHPVEAAAADRPGGQGFLPPLGDRAVACTRLPCGDQLFVMGPPGEQLTAPQAPLEELLKPQPMPIQVKGPRLLAWIRRGEEPSAHFLNELKELESFPLPVELLEEEPPMDLPRVLGLDPDRLPLLALVGEDGLCYYAAGGYQVGSAALVRRLGEKLGKTAF